MKYYKISIPGFALDIFAKNQTEALEQFWFDFDTAQEDPDWQRPTIKEIKKPSRGIRRA